MAASGRWGIVSHAGYLPYRRLDRSGIVGGSRHRRWQRDPNGGFLRRGHHDDGGRGGPPGPRSGAWRPAGRGVPGDHRSGLSRQDQRHRRARRPPAGQRRGRRSTSAGPSAARSWPCATPWRGSEPTLVVAAICAPACRAARTRRPAATVRPPCWSVPSPTVRCWPSWSAWAARPRSSSTAGANRVICARRSGRSASARANTSPSASEAWAAALKDAGVGPDAVDHLIVTGLRAAAVRGAVQAPGRLGRQRRGRPRRHASVRSGAAHPALLLSALARTGRAPTGWSRSSSLADGADVLSCGPRPPSPTSRRPRPVAVQLAAGGAVALREVPVLAGLPAGRAAPATRAVPGLGIGGQPVGRMEVRLRRLRRRQHRPDPAPAGVQLDEPLEPIPMADALGTVATFTVDRLSYSPSPPVVFAVVDFDGGGRLPRRADRHRRARRPRSATGSR